ncbi:CHASE3 domain-containing protein [filamentous cyanobacterium LEGE 11480]|uniref:histidine kinase n=1 Tax=Romeriopsis navalis LEGE 11480 TaxID=2777977 RepID=A0A928VRW4_9CYAN|nr:CHASE3 domain-containing protein [Romeriopsis navalis]MBE9031432.1 CHASE3 domain-containing protein [Romeriopsis navalis LEGE 11480]
MQQVKSKIQPLLRKLSQQISIGRWGALLVAIPASCLAIVLLVVMDARSTELRLQQQVNATEARLETSRRILQYLVDHETGLRGYLLTQDQTFLQPYRLAKLALPNALKTLEQQSPQQRSAIADLQQQINARFAVTEQLLEFAQAIDRQTEISRFTGPKRTLAKPESQELLEKLLQGKQKTDILRQTVAQFQASQQKQLKQQQRQLQARKQLIDRIQIIGAILSVITYAGVVYLFRVLDQEIFQRRRELDHTTAANRTLTDNLVDGVIMIDQQGLIETLNPAAELILGYKSASLRGRSLVNILFPPKTDRRQALINVENWVNQRLESGLVERMEANRPDGQVIPIELSISRSDPASRTLIVLLRDVSERIRLANALQEKVGELATLNQELSSTNQLLQRQKQSLENFVHAAAHDLKTPLRGIASLAQWIEADLVEPLDSETKNHFQLLHQRVKRIQAMIDGLLSYARIDSWIEPSQMVDLNLIVAEVCQQIPVPDNFDVQTPHPLPKLRSSYLAMRLIFDQLIRNAIEHHDRDRGTIIIKVQSHAQQVELVIQDDGPGIAPAYRQQMFKMFQVLEHAPNASEHLGIGLSLVHKTINLIGGTIELHPVPESLRGLAVHLILPQLPETENNH